LIDCDPQGNATTGLGIDRVHLGQGLYDFILGSATEEEILLEQRQLATQYDYFLSLGLRYTFGSIYSNVVNPRFGGLDRD